MSDQNFLKRILLAVAGRAVLFRNNVGLGWTGELFKPTVPTTVKVGPGDVVIRNARPLHAGLTVGSGDLIGWTTIEIAPTDVGRRVALFTSVEAKQGTGRLTPDQRNFRDQVLAAGGLAGVARSTDDALAIVAPAVSA